jgi:signal transduction histidine kinase
MGLHRLLPLIACLLNLSLGGTVLLRHPTSRLNRLFAAFVSTLAVWNFGVFMLRRAPDHATALFWEVVIHVGVILMPALYYHFVLAFLDSVGRHRRSLGLAYGLAAVFFVLNISRSPWFIKGVTWTSWGWAPVSGLVYQVQLGYFLLFLVWGLGRLLHAHGRMDSSFRRNRAMLIVLGGAVSLAGGIIDMVRFVVADFIPAAERMYPVGIPANMVFALMVATSIVRYRLFDVNVAVKRVAIYAVAGAVITSTFLLAVRLVHWKFDPGEIHALWVVVPMGLVTTLLLSPVGQQLEERIERLMFSRRRGCYDTLIALSKRMTAILDLGKLVDTLLDGLVGGIPLTHCVLLIEDRTTMAFDTYRERTTLDRGGPPTSLRPDSPIVQWLTYGEGVLVKEEVKLNPRLAAHFASVREELDRLRASVIVPLRIEDTLIGILLLGEKLSGEIFDAQELELLSVMANQAAIAIENARLYESQEIRAERLRTLAHLNQLISSSLGMDAVLREIAQAAAHLTETTVVSCWVADEDARILEVRAFSDDRFARGFPRKAVSFDEGGTGWVAAHRRPLYIEDVCADDRIPDHEWWRFHDLKSFYGVPIALEGTLLGVVSLMSSAPIRFAQDTLDLLDSFVAQAAVAIRNARLYEERTRAYEELSRTQDQLVQAQKMEAVGRLAGGIAHDFNNLLTVIQGRSELALGRPEDTDQLRRSLELIRETAERATALTRQLLAFSRRQVLQPQILDISAVVENVRTMLIRLIGEHIELVTQLDPHRARVKADRAQLEQVLLNLVVNARDAMPDGGRLTIQTASVELDEAMTDGRPGGYVMLAVQDTGRGMSGEIKARIFEPFFTTKEVGKGTGLGLATVYGIVKQHEGYVAVDSEPGHGTTFRIYLPRAAGHIATIRPRAAAGQPTRGAETILLVEDEAEVRALAREIIEQQGYTVLEAASGIEALSICGHRPGPIDLLLTDVVMPQMSGRELADRLVSARPDMKVLYMSGYTDDAIVHHGVLDLGKAFLQKPFKAESLARKVREVLDTPR